MYAVREYRLYWQHPSDIRSEFVKRSSRSRSVIRERSGEKDAIWFDGEDILMELVPSVLFRSTMTYLSVSVILWFHIWSKQCLFPTVLGEMMLVNYRLVIRIRSPVIGPFAQWAGPLMPAVERYPCTYWLPIKFVSRRFATANRTRNNKTSQGFFSRSPSVHIEVDDVGFTR